MYVCVCDRGKLASGKWRNIILLYSSFSLLLPPSILVFVKQKAMNGRRRRISSPSFLLLIHQGCFTTYVHTRTAAPFSSPPYVYAHEPLIRHCSRGGKGGVGGLSRGGKRGRSSIPLNVIFPSSPLAALPPSPPPPTYAYVKYLWSLFHFPWGHNEEDVKGVPAKLGEQGPSNAYRGRLLT